MPIFGTPPLISRRWAARSVIMTSQTMIVIAVGAAGGVFVTLLVRWFTGRKLDVWLQDNRRIFVTGIVAAVISGLLYSVVHEFGHFIFAVALGGTVRSVTWTVFGNAEPHVSYGDLPHNAVPGQAPEGIWSLLP